MTITVAVPDAAMLDRLRLDRLRPVVDDVILEVWTTDDPPLDHPVDMLVLPYSVSAAALPKLAHSPVSVIQSQSLGYDSVERSLPAGLVYCNAVGVHEGPTAELAVALILESQRGLDVVARAQPSGSWARGWYPGLLGRSVLIVGVGGVGEAVAARLEPFGVTISRVARSAREDARGSIHSIADLPQLLGRADIVVLGVPLTEETTGMVDAAFLAHLKPGALLVNVSRGAIVDTDALTDAVRSGALRAALDVVEPEPLPPDHPLWILPGVIITPHIGGNISSMPSRVDPLVREQIERLLNNLEPLNIVVDKRTGK
ncbi:MAG: NAD(P)-dependent oxidoreductase [Actinomycetota bacterium]